jgi:hypothetical protein
VIPEIPARLGVTWSLYLPLRWDRELMAYQHAGYAGRTAPFSASDERVVWAFAQLGAAGMATIRLLGAFADENQVQRIRTSPISLLDHLKVPAST